MAKAPARVDQFLPSYAPYDAIGIHATHMQKRIQERGFTSEIFYEHWRAETRQDSHFFPEHENVTSPDNLIIYHHSIGSYLPNYLAGVSDYCIQSYHNITPAEYFHEHMDRQAQQSCSEGVRQLNILKAVARQNWTVSTYNAEELQLSGFKDIDTFPILRDYSALTREATDPSGCTKPLQDGKTNLLFVGRVCPHKSQHDLMLLLRCYKSHVSNGIRLILIGGHSPDYTQRLRELAVDLGLTIAWGLESPEFATADVVIPGQITDPQMADFYRCASAFVCMSEHEGFCVPLVEAMFFGLPLLVNDAAAVPETVGNAGIVIDKAKNPEAAIGFFKALAESPEFAKTQQAASLRRAEDYVWDKLVSKFDLCFDKALAKFGDQKSH